jgi:hypothetical protein
MDEKKTTFGDLEIGEAFFYQPPKCSQRRYVKRSAQEAYCEHDKNIYFFPRSAEIETRPRLLHQLRPQIQS